MKTIIIIVIIGIVGLVAMAVTSSMVTDIVDSGVNVSTIAADAISVTISGQVNSPGTYVLDKGSVLIDLIDAAGGTNGNADSLAFNTDYALSNKGSYYIAPLYDNNDACSITAIEKCNVNTADATTLQEVAGFGKSAANALVSYRISSQFEALEEIKNVSGIGEATYTTVRDRLRLRDGSSSTTTTNYASSSVEEAEEETSSSEED